MDSLPPVPPPAAAAPAPTPKTIITPIVRHGLPVPAISPAASVVTTAFDAPPALVAEVQNKAAHVRSALSNAVKAVDAGVKAILSLDALVSDPQASQLLAAHGLDADTLKRFTKASQPLLAYVQAAPTPATP